MTRTSRYLRAIAIGLTCAGCEREQATAGYSCPEGFRSGIVFDPGAAQRLRVELCTDADCASASYPPDPEPVQTPGFFAEVRFIIGKDQLGEWHVNVVASPREEIADGEVQTHTLSVYDADTSSVLASHTETVTYQLITVTAATNQCVHGEFSFPDAGDAGD